ncbi:hypothetical protein BASA81_011033 [Batrachochytrium salamandrivorans]|nr:hypothetical protein BASA81_011033 [Batrachochytrium salamandrivorans]
MVLAPKHCAEAIAKAKGKTLIITGAGVSTEFPSSLPDYRGVNGRYRQPSYTKAMTHQEYMGSLANRQRFWGRSLFGFSSFELAQPNRSHHMLHRLQAGGLAHGIITQNVDRLHFKAGSADAVELHGRGDLVECQTCFATMVRSQFQAQMRAANREWIASVGEDRVEQTADGDALLPSVIDTSQLRILPCHQCGAGVWKPQFVFFGGSVPREVAARANHLVSDAELVLLIGSTAHTFSCYRLLRDARMGKKPVFIINQGPTRADELAISKHDSTGCGEFLQQVEEELLSG